MAVRFSIVWLATWPRFSPVTSALASSRSAISSAMRIIMRRYSTTASSAGPASRRRFCASVNGTTVTERSACQRASCLPSASTLSRDFSPMYGGEWK